MIFPGPHSADSSDTKYVSFSIVGASRDGASVISVLVLGRGEPEILSKTFVQRRRSAGMVDKEMVYF